MRKIPLTQGKYAFVDDADYILVSRFKWYYEPPNHRRTGYAAWRGTIDGKKQTIKMQNLIMGKRKNMLVDHQDNDGLNNQRYNLRFGTRSQNQANKPKYRLKDTISEFKGAYWQSQINRWYSRISLNGKDKYLGTFSTAKEAAQAYNAAAIKYHKEFASLNDV